MAACAANICNCWQLPEVGTKTRRRLLFRRELQKKQDVVTLQNQFALFCSGSEIGGACCATDSLLRKDRIRLSLSFCCMLNKSDLSRAG